MRCLNCGKELAKGARFCSACGTAVMPGSEESETAPIPEAGETAHIPKKKRSSLRTILILAVALSGVLVLTNILHNNNNENELLYGEPEDSQEIDPEWEAKQEQIYEYGIDLSMYDEHGEWSNDRMWVHRTDSGWDHSEGYYAYIDTEGNVVGQWHSDQSWVCPQSFVGDRALIYLGNDLDNTPMRDFGYDEKAYYGVIDLQGNVQYSFVTYINGDFNEASTNAEQLHINKQILHKFDENGYLYYKAHTNKYGYSDPDDVTTWPKTHLLIPDTSEFLRDIEFESYVDDTYEHWTMIVDYDLDAFAPQYVNGYLRYEDDYVANGVQFIDFVYFDQHGRIAIDIMDHMKGYTPTALSDVRDDQTFTVTFRGKDGKGYQIDMDFDGNWLTEPKLVD